MSAHSDPERDFRPSASWERLRLRAELARRIRSFFDHRRFLEVETPLLSADTVVDRHIDPLCVERPHAQGPQSQMWIQTSPEFAMKRLLASGADAIYQICRAFRAGERGRLHNPEFTILEWYRRGDSMDRGMELLSDLVVEVLGTEAAERRTFGEAFERFAGVEPHSASPDELAAACRQRGLVAPDGTEASEREIWLELLLTECVEPELGRDRPCILYDYPASQAMLARVRPGDPPVAERFELYIHGIELANGYHELLDAAVLRQRASLANTQRIADGMRTLPEQSRLLAAMEGGYLPACAGVALGFDRLVMIAAGASHIDEVLAFPVERA